MISNRASHIFDYMVGKVEKMPKILYNSYQKIEFPKQMKTIVEFGWSIRLVNEN